MEGKYKLRRKNMRRCHGCMREYRKEFDVCPHCGYVVDTAPKIKSHLSGGTVLAERYMLGKVLGHGGFGITYIAWDKKLSRTVAIKEFFPNALSTRSEGETQVSCYDDKASRFFRDGVKKMLDEGTRLSKFTDNENIVNVYDCFEENNTAYIVMEYLDGEDLKKYIEEKGGKLSPEEAVEKILPVLNALEDMHKEKLIHRDISPDNIFLCKNGKIKLLDFGSARLAIEDSDKSLSVMVKRGYAPKEQYMSRSKQGPWTDVYAVCATLYKMITGVLPTESTERDEEPLKKLSEFGITGCSELEKVIFKGLEVEYKNRIQSIAELRNGLTKPVQKKSAPVVAETPKKADDPKVSASSEKQEKPVGTKKPAFKFDYKILLAIAAVVVFGIGIVFGIKALKSKPETSESDTKGSSGVVTTEAEKPENTEVVSLDINEAEAKAIYEEFLGSEELKIKYPNIYAIKTKDISVCSKEYFEYLEMNNVKSFSSAFMDLKFYDLDNDGTNEMLLSTDANGEDFYVDLYLFDIDENNDVFEGGSFLRLMPSRCYDHIAVMQNTESNYYFIRYTNDGQHSKSCEKLVYNGQVIKSEFSLYAGNPNLECGYGIPTFIKSEEDNSSVYLFDEENDKNSHIKISYTEYISEWESCFNNKHITGYCDHNWDEQAQMEPVDIRSHGKLTDVIEWTLYETEMLIIEGIGEMPNFDNSPWINFKNDISEAIIYKGITSIGEGAFDYCTSLTSVTIPDSVTSIGDDAFASCFELQSITIPNSVKNIGDNAFNNCQSLTQIHIPNSVINMGNSTFYCSGLERVTIGNGIKNIGYDVFAGCDNLTSVIIPNGVTSIGEAAFFGCNNLTNITIPDSVTNIGYQAFDCCDSLENVYYSGSTWQWLSISIGEKNEILTKARIHYNS